MGRPSSIKPAIISVLSKATNPLRFSELRLGVQFALNRKSLDDKQFNTNLQSMVSDGSVERTLLNGKVAYALTSGYYEQKLKLTLIQLLNNRKLSQLYDRMEGEEIPPFIVFADPPAFDYEAKKPLESADLNSFGGGPMTKAGDIRSVPDWSDPSRAISSIMENDFRGFLSAKERNNLINLCRWAYWAGCKEYIENNMFMSLEKSIKQNKDFALQCSEKFADDSRRVETEKMLLRILDITEELIRKNNLQEFLGCLIEHRDEHARLLNAILCIEGPMNGGERIFTRFFEFGSRIAAGLNAAGLLHDNIPLNRMPLHERFFLTTSKVWDDFFNGILFGPDFGDSDPMIVSDLQRIGGTQKEAIVSVREFKDSLNFLLDLPFKRKIAVLYLWGFPESVLLSDRSSIRDFDDWRSALNEGRLDHRVWLFSEKTLSRLGKAYRAVKQHKAPPNIRIDKEEWSLEDLYWYHPLGKQVEFWRDFIDEIRTRAGKKRRVYGGGPVPKGVYEEFKRRETEAVEETLDEEEEAQTKHARNKKR
jgi:hypothetical protein